MGVIKPKYNKNTEEYLDKNSGFTGTENIDKVGSFNYENWGGGSGIGSKGNLEKLGTDILNSDYSSFTSGSDYKDLENRFSQAGRRAMQDTIGQVAARTGGLASSYATVAGQQSFNDYMKTLEDAARSMYESQMTEKMNKLGVAQGMYDRNYSEWQDGRDFAFTEYQSDLDNARFKDSTAMSMHNTGLGQANREDDQLWAESEAERNQGNIDREYNYKVSSNEDAKKTAAQKDEKDRIYSDAYYGNSASYEEYLATHPETDLSKEEYNSIITAATGQRADDTYGRDEEELQAEKDRIYSDAYYGNSASYEEYLATHPDTDLSKEEYNSIITAATGQRADDTKITKDAEYERLFGAEDFLWGDWDGDGLVGENDTDGEIKDGKVLTFDDVYGGSSFGEEYWADFAKEAQAGHAERRQAELAKEIETMIANGKSWDDIVKQFNISHNSVVKDKTGKSIEEWKSIANDYEVEGYTYPKNASGKAAITDSLVNSISLKLNEQDAKNFDYIYGDNAYEKVQRLIATPLKDAQSFASYDLFVKSIYDWMDQFPAGFSEDAAFDILERAHPKHFNIVMNGELHYPAKKSSSSGLLIK